MPPQPAPSQSLVAVGTEQMERMVHFWLEGAWAFALLGSDLLASWWPTAHPAAAPSLPCPAMCPATPPTIAPLMQPFASALADERANDSTATGMSNNFMMVLRTKWSGTIARHRAKFLGGSPKIAPPDDCNGTSYPRLILVLAEVAAL